MYRKTSKNVNIFGGNAFLITIGFWITNWAFKIYGKIFTQLFIECSSNPTSPTQMSKIHL